MFRRLLLSIVLVIAGVVGGMVLTGRMETGDPQCVQALPFPRSIGAPQFEQLTTWTLFRSSCSCTGESGRMNPFSRRKSKKVMNRPWSAGHRR